MADRTITTNAGQHAVFETGSADTIIVEPGVTVQAQGSGANAIRTDGLGDEIILRGSGNNIVNISKTGDVLASHTGVIAFGDGNQVTNAGSISGSSGIEAAGNLKKAAMALGKTSLACLA